MIGWQPHENTRHAYPAGTYADGDEVPALCGAEVVIRRGLDEVAWLALTCEECMRLAWSRVNPNLLWPLDDGPDRGNDGNQGRRRG